MPKKIGREERDQLRRDEFEKKYKVNSKINAALKSYSQSIKGRPLMRKEEVYKRLKKVSDHPDSDEDTTRQFMYNLLSPMFDGEYNPESNDHNPIPLRDAYDLYQELAKLQDKSGYYSSAADSYDRAGYIARYAKANATANKLFRKASEERGKPHALGLVDKSFMSADRTSEEITRDNRIFEKKRKVWKNALESKVASIIAISGLVLGVFFTSSNFTGNVIGVSNSTSLGAILFILGLISAFWYFKKRNQ